MSDKHFKERGENPWIQYTPDDTVSLVWVMPVLGVGFMMKVDGVPEINLLQGTILCEYYTQEQSKIIGGDQKPRNLVKRELVSADLIPKEHGEKPPGSFVQFLVGEGDRK